jgi:hypothetical protein
MALDVSSGRHPEENAMDGLILAAEILGLLVVVIGIVLYAAPAIADPVRRLLDWLFDHTTG